MLNTRQVQVRKLTFSAMFLAIGLVLPFFTGQIPQIGSMLLPMHLPVFICGMVCGGGWGGIVGFILPLLRYALFGMPPIFPKGISMAFELAVYGMMSGFLYSYIRRRGTGGERRIRRGFSQIYAALIPSMLVGRIVWGLVFALLCGMAAQAFTFHMFLMGAFVEAIPGIIIQLVFVPILVRAIGSMNVFEDREKRYRVRKDYNER